MIIAFLTGWEIVVVLALALLLFGTRLPKVARSLGSGVAEFKRGVKGITDDIEKAGDDRKDEDEDEKRS